MGRRRPVRRHSRMRCRYAPPASPRIDRRQAGAAPARYSVTKLRQEVSEIPVRRSSKAHFRVARGDIEPIARRLTQRNVLTAKPRFPCGVNTRVK